MVNICYSGNKAMFEGLTLSIMSVIKNCEDDINFFVLTMDLREENPKFLPFTDEQIELLNKLVKEKNKNNRVVKVDLTKEYKEYLISGKNHENGYTPFAMLRLLLDLIYKKYNMSNKIIYLDIDTMSVGDISELYNLDVENYDFCAVKDYLGRFWIRSSYCNSGVLLLNMENAIKSALFKKCRTMVCDVKMLMPDQTALNKYGTKKYIPFKFNEQRKIKSDTVIKHFCKGIVFFLPFGFHIYNIKQWQQEDVHKRLKVFMFDDLYDKLNKLKQDNKSCF